MTDAELVQAFRKGDREAFSGLVERYARPLTLMILRMVRNEDDARDLSQSVFLKAYEAMPRFLMTSSFKTWLYRIALNAVQDHLRKSRPPMESEGLEDVPMAGNGPDDALDNARAGRRLREAIDALPEKQRLTLQLRVYEEMEYDRIADIIGSTPAAARMNFFQAVKTLKARL